MTIVTPRTLILATSYIAEAKEGAQNYGAKMVRLWADLTVHLNPGVDILIVDSASPVNIHDAIGPKPDGLRILQLGDNVGHINNGGADGWGRAMSKGIEWAIRRGYDYIAYADVDIIFTRPVGPIINKMALHGVKAAIPMDCQYAFLENGLMFLDAAYLRDSDFVARYDWGGRKLSADPMEIPEMVFERLLGDALFTLPLRTYRDDGNRLTVNNLSHLFPYGLDALTHVRDFAVYEKFLEIKGINL